MSPRSETGKHRTQEQLREHYEIEKQLATRLRNASKQERRHLYSSLYDELYRRVPLHPLLTRKLSPENTTEVIALQMRFLHPFFARRSVFLEIGPGDCALSVEAAKYVNKVYAADVSAEITKGREFPKNLEVILFDGCNLTLAANSVDIAYSNQLIEHLHPDDALDQLRSIYGVLMPGGEYVCVTPNRLHGPHDVSQYFDEVATGFHLKEYTITELANLMQKAGFSKLKVYIAVKGNFIRLPLFGARSLEYLLEKLPHSPRRALAYSLPFRWLCNIRLVGTKQ